MKEYLRGLGYFRAEDVAEKLAAKLKIEMPYGRPMIVSALGRSNTAKGKAALLELVKGPTMIVTKLTWIEASQHLSHPDVVPTLKEWASSPNEDLRKAALAEIPRRK